MMWILIAAVIFSADLLIKKWAEKSLSDKEEINKGPLRLRLVRNRGAFLNLGDKQPKLVLGISLAVSIVCSIYYTAILRKPGRNLMKVGLTLLLGGAWNNVYDRMKRGYVVDYAGVLKTDAFYNLSDVAVMAGVIVTAIHQMKE